VKTPPQTFTPVDRGWYLASFYPESSHPEFESLVEQLKTIGDFANLLDENAAVIYRNILRDPEILSFWPFFQKLSKKETEWFLKGTALSWETLQELIQCRLEKQATPLCPEYLLPSQRIGCGDQSILFDLDSPLLSSSPLKNRKETRDPSSLRGKFWFEFYRWKKEDLFIKEPKKMKDYFQQNLRHTHCYLSRLKEALVYLEALPSKISIVRDFGWSFLLKARYWPSWLIPLKQQQFVALSPHSVPEPGTLMCLMRSGEKILIFSPQGENLGYLKKESLSPFQALEPSQKILGIIQQKGSYYFHFQLCESLIVSHIPCDSEVWTVSPAPSATPPYQQFVQHFFQKKPKTSALESETL
jgi:hypothetical protein